MKTSAPISTPSVWLNPARVFQVTIICITIGLFIMSIPANYEARSVVCRNESCPGNQLTARSEQVLAQVGVTVDSFVKWTIGLDILLAAIFTVSAIVIFVRKPNDPFTIFVTVMLVTFGVATFSGGVEGIAASTSRLRVLAVTLALIGNCSIIAFLFVFPNGTFTPRWTVLILAVWILLQLPRYYVPNSPIDLTASYPNLYNLIFPLGILSGILTQIYRYTRVSNAVERQQTKWVIYGLTIGIGGYLIVRAFSLYVNDPYGDGLLINITLNVIAIFFILLLPLSISIAVIRYRLWDINPIINRTLVYGMLSALTIAFYIFAVGFFANYFQRSSVNLIISFLATGIVAILFEPLRKWLQRAVNRLMYGERDDPATILSRLGQRLDSTIAPESTLQTIVDTIAQTLRLPYVAISIVSPDEAFSITSTGAAPDVASPGLIPSERIHLPLSYQTERVGELVLAPRAAGESFSTEDMDLLNIIAGQAGIVVHNFRLAKDLQRSRERLVTAQEEERRRLRRDLHDGVGPTLASLTQRLDTAADLVNSDPQASVALMKELKGQVRNTVGEIRRLVYALRPPVLDEFGLVTAIREHVAQYAGPNGMQVRFEVAEPMPVLPAAVEVAAYRIVLEAFTNVINHAQASACHIRLIVKDRSLLLEVSDNGIGMTGRSHTGVGLSSMRERAEELGGRLIVEENTPCGTIVKSTLPLMDTQKE